MFTAAGIYLQRACSWYEANVKRQHITNVEKVAFQLSDEVASSSSLFFSEDDLNIVEWYGSIITEIFRLG